MNILTLFAHEGHDHAADAAHQTTTVAPQVTQVVTHAATEATHAAESAGGLSALGLNWQSFLFQLITFVIVYLILRQFVLKKIIAVLESRRTAVEDSIKHATQAEERLKNVEGQISTMLGEARKQADDVLAASHKEAASMIEAAEAKAAKRADHIVSEAKNQMQNEVSKARADLKAETAQLVAMATEKIIGEKLDAKKDASLIEKALAKEQP